MNIVAFVLFGLIVGVIANYLDPQPSKGGVRVALVLGVLGSIIGGILGNVIFGIGLTSYNFATLSIGVLASLMVLLVSRGVLR